MRKTTLLVLLISFISSLSMAQFRNLKAPIAKQVPQTLTNLGHDRIDPYFWMNQRDSQPVLDYISEENAYSAAYFNELKPLTDHLLEEFEARIDPNETSAPFIIQGNTYQWESIEGLDYRNLIQLSSGKRSLFFNENERAKGHEYYGLGSWSNSPDNKLLAISEDIVGRRKYTIQIRDNKTGKYLKDKITNTDGSIIWANDNRTFFYVKKDETTLREFQVYRHVLGSKQSEDVLVYEELDERFYVYISKTFDDQFVAFHSESSTTSETSIVSADKPTEKAQIFLKRVQNHMYSVDHHELGFYLLSNDQAPNRKLCFSTEIPESILACKVIIPGSKSEYLDEFIAFQSHLVIQYRKGGSTYFKAGEIKSESFETLPTKEKVYEMSLSYNDDYHAHSFRFAYNSLTTPASISSYDLLTKKTEQIYTKQLRDKTFSPDNYVSERIWATATDGTLIPISLVYKKGTDLSKAPLLLYGYGSYGVTIPANFSAYRISLLDRGFVYAIAHIRGGKFLGEDWYQDGKLQHKRNTFNDFVNAAEWLGMKGYCDPSSIYAQGGSAGGLLMGAIANQAPYLFKGIIAQVAFVDVVTTMLDETIPLTVGEYEEWGNPNEEDSYWYMLSYSPYDQVKRMDYPALLITTGYHDSQVQYWEPLKWTAKLRAYNTGTAPILFDCTMSAGHGGGSGRSTERYELAKEFAFLLQQQGIEN